MNVSLNHLQLRQLCSAAVILLVLLFTQPAFTRVSIQLHKFAHWSLGSAEHGSTRTPLALVAASPAVADLTRRIVFVPAPLLLQPEHTLDALITRRKAHAVLILVPEDEDSSIALRDDAARQQFFELEVNAFSKSYQVPIYWTYFTADVQAIFAELEVRVSVVANSYSWIMCSAG